MDNYSDHNTILTCMAPEHGQQYRLTLLRFNIRTVDWRKFSRHIAELRSQGCLITGILSAEGVSSAAIAIRDVIIETCNHAMKAHVKSVTLWTHSLTVLKRKMFQMERAPELRERKRSMYLNFLNTRRPLEKSDAKAGNASLP